MQLSALTLTVAWLRLEKALEAYQAQLRREHGVTVLQLSILAILSERPALPLAALRKGLVMHAATLGQAVDELRRMGLVSVRTNPEDKRARVVALTDEGAALLAKAPLAGPARLRQTQAAPERLETLAQELGELVEVFGLGDWVPDKK